MCNLLGGRIWKDTVDLTPNTVDTGHNIDGHMVLRFSSAHFVLEVCKWVEYEALHYHCEGTVKAL